MTENKVQTSKWKKHEIEENIGHEKFKNNQLWMGSFNFVIGADTRLDSAWSCMEQNKKDWKLNLNKAIYAIDKINNLTPRPQFVVICGNFVNEMPNNWFLFSFFTNCSKLLSSFTFLIRS
uniref:Calcineurin-like phosphoesterase domain-containing protein 1 n=1 Tax=Sipha flava TaxID=143950 RepID=A0A2S2PUP4_9HEMI